MSRRQASIIAVVLTVLAVAAGVMWLITRNRVFVHLGLVWLGIALIYFFVALPDRKRR